MNVDPGAASGLMSALWKGVADCAPVQVESIGIQWTDCIMLTLLRGHEPPASPCVELSVVPHAFLPDYFEDILSEGAKIRA